MKKSEYKFYITPYDDQDNEGFEIDLEKDFEGLRYVSCKGLNNIGEPRVYTETFSDEKSLSVYIPDKITRETTDVTLTIAFFGDNRQQVYTSFVEELSHCKHYYRDTARKRGFTFVLKKAITPSEDVLNGKTKYLKADFVLTNLDGITSTYKT